MSPIIKAWLCKQYHEPHYGCKSVMIIKKLNQFANANLVKLVYVAYKEIAVTSRNLGVRNVNHVLQQNGPHVHTPFYQCTNILQNSNG